MRDAKDVVPYDVVGCSWYKKNAIDINMFGGRAQLAPTMWQYKIGWCVMVLLFSQIVPNWRADMESAPTLWMIVDKHSSIEMNRREQATRPTIWFITDWLGLCWYAGRQGCRPLRLQNVIIS